MSIVENIKQVIEKMQANKLSTVIPLLLPISIEFCDNEGMFILFLWQEPMNENKASNLIARENIHALLYDCGIQPDAIDQIEKSAFNKYLAMRSIEQDKVCALSAKEMEDFFERCDALIKVADVPKELNPVDLYYRSQVAEIEKIKILKEKLGIEKQYAILLNYVTSKLVVYQNRAIQCERSNVMENAVKNSRSIFIIHGHDESKRRELEAILKDRFGLKPIVLSDEPSQGLTIIEKFEKYAAECSYAFALFTADDIIQNNNQQYFQARPNVIFELGWFYANLGRSRVCILDKSSEKSKIFSDLQGVMRIQFSENISEKIIDIERELRSVGIIA